MPTCAKLSVSPMGIRLRGSGAFAGPFLGNTAFLDRDIGSLGRQKSSTLY